MKGIKEHSKLKDNYKEYTSNSFDSPLPIDVIVVIGESTSSMNMNLYGYFRNTTPFLSSITDKQNFYFFDNILSTHTHTSPSLLEALSIPQNKSPKSEKIDDIYNQPRHSIIDILESKNIPTNLYNNQNPSGSWNYANTIIFKNVGHRIDEKKGVTLGNLESKESTEKYDDMLILKHIDEIFENRGVTFIHTYSGHGGYCSNIPQEYRSKVDNFLNQLKPHSVIGYSNTIKESIECYDSAIKYIDSNLEKIITRSEKSNTPKVIIYFSDHGESVYTGNGHDSSRFRLEMLKIPFLIYFNDAYLEKHEAEQALKVLDNNINDLSIFPYVLAELLKIDIGEYKRDNKLFIRKVANNLEYIDINSTSNKYWLLNQYLINKKTETKNICLHRANNIARIVRGNIAFDCIELDLIIEDNSTLIRHDPLEKEQKESSTANLTLDYLIEKKLLESKMVWVDGKNIDTIENCNIALESLKNANFNFLIEFPSKSIENLESISSCIEDFNRYATYTSYYIPTSTLLSCNQGKLSDCILIEGIIDRINKSQLFNSISFDFNGYDAIQKTTDKLDVKLALHAWHIDFLDNKKLDNLDLKIINSQEMDNPY